jgi:cell fate regulator YaaT (PSP1 superfamily)
MTLVVAIRFKDSGKNHWYDPRNLTNLQAGEVVIVDTVRGPELAKVAHPPQEIPPDTLESEVRPIIRRASKQDFERMARLFARHDDVLKRCSELVKSHNLPMHLVKAEYSFDGSRLTFYFTADNRVDFRLLVRDLARTFRSRIELRQIGARDEARLLGGIGPCGRILCCASFLPDYARVSIKMAKDQDLPLNPAKISGVCGRLLCCLSYEHQQYLDMKADLPARDSWVQTPDGPGEVVTVNVLRESVLVRLAGSGMEAEYTRDQISQATDVVGSVARQRNQDGITPHTRRASADPAGAEDENDLAVLRLLDDETDLVSLTADAAAAPAQPSQRPKPDRREGQSRTGQPATRQRTVQSGGQPTPEHGTRGERPSRSSRSSRSSPSSHPERTEPSRRPERTERSRPERSTPQSSASSRTGGKSRPPGDSSSSPRSGEPKRPETGNPSNPDKPRRRRRPPPRNEE